MPSLGDTSRASTSFTGWVVRVLQWLWYAVLIGVAAFCVTLLAVRYVVFPHVEDYRDDVIEALSKQLGQPVEIDRLATGWDGWNPKLIVYGFRVRSGAGDAASPPVLDLPEVNLIVAWTSLPALDLRLKELVLEGPRLAVRRDKNGKLHVGGVAVDPDQMGGDAPIVDWLLRQPHIAVHDALITWKDDVRNTGELVLDHVQLRLESRFGRHRFGLLGTPPADIASTIDVRGDLRVGSATTWEEATGKVYARVDYADIAAWSQWLPMPAIRTGKGALRFWLDVDAGKPRDLTADLELLDVKARIEPELPELDLASLAGRAGWSIAPPRRELSARNLVFVTTSGSRFDAAQLSLAIREASGNGPATNLLEFDRLQLAPLRELAAHLPLPEKIRTDLAELVPRGTLTHGRVLWEGEMDAPSVYNAAAEFTDVGVAPRGNVPGLQGLSGRIEMTQAGGDLKMSSRSVMVDAPQWLTTPVALERVASDVSWENTPQRTSVKLEKLEFTAGETVGRASGVYHTAAQGPGTIDFNARLNQVSVAQVHQRLPSTLDPAVREWLISALTAGSAGEVRMRAIGNLADFPFRGGKGGQFLVTTKVKDVGLRFANSWPALSDVEADFRVEGTRLTVDATEARIAGIPIGKFKVEIDDLRAERPLLTIDGAASVATSDVLRFIDSSPVAGWVDHYTDGAQATGNGRLDLEVALPLGAVQSTKVTGEYTFTGNDIKMKGVPPLSKASGTLRFTEKGITAQDVAVELLGGPAKLDVTSERDEVHLTGSGTTNTASVRKEFSLPYIDAVTGSLDWTASAFIGAATAWTLESSLRGTAIDLPVPLGKAATDAMPLKIERRATPGRADEDSLSISYGQIGRLILHRKLAPTGDTVDRGLFLIGGAVAASANARGDRPGLWVRGELPAFNVDDWMAVKRRLAAASSSALATSSPDTLELVGVDLDVAALEAAGRRFNDMKIVARRAKDDWRLELRAREAAGTATWLMPSADAPNGRITARLTRLVPPDAGDMPPWKSGDPAPSPTKVEAGTDNPWPDVDVRAEAFFARGRDIGQLEFIAHPRGTEWQIEKLAVTNDAGHLEASGRWQSAGRDQQTKLDVALTVSDAGKFLTRMGYFDALQNAPSKVTGALSWAGGPSDFDYPSLSGEFRVEVGPGRFTKIDPGFGKLLGVLSLQSLPRRITLDFTDVFSEGFAFDEVTGDMRVQSGVMKTSNLKLVGPAAKVEINGEVNIAKETQQLSVRILPSLSSSFSAGAALFFLANPIIGAAVGAGTLLAQKVLKDPLEQMFSYEYQVTGSWADPVVTRGSVATVAVSPDGKPRPQ